MPPEPLLTFGLFTDAHYAHKVYGDRHCEDSVAKVGQAVETFNARRAAFVINLGDTVDKHEDAAVEIGYLETMRDAVIGFHGPSYTVLGNHDLDSLTRRQFHAHSGATIPHGHYTFDAPGCRVIVLDADFSVAGNPFDGRVGDWTESFVPAVQLTWLADQLRTATGPCVVCCHQNLDERYHEGRLDPHVVRNHADVRRTLEAAGNVVAVLQGHYHHGCHQRIAGIDYLTLTAMVTGPGLANNAFAIAALHTDGTLHIEGFGRQPGVVLGRRS